MAFPEYVTTVPTLSSWQMSYNGLAIGPGTPYEMTSMEGWTDLPVIASGDGRRGRTFGELPGYNFLAGRDIDCMLDLGFKNGLSTTQGLLQSLQIAMLPLQTGVALPNQELPLWVQIPNRPVVCAMARVMKIGAPYNMDYANSGRIPVQLWWHATDPRLYGAPVQTSQSYTSTTSVSIPTITYAGDVDMNPQITFTNTSGSVSKVTVSCSIGGIAKWSINIEPGTVANNSAYVIDTDLHTVTKAGVGYYPATGNAPTWPNLIAGVGGMMTSSSKSVVISASWTGSGTGTLKVNYAPAYLV